MKTQPNSSLTALFRGLQILTGLVALIALVLVFLNLGAAFAHSGYSRGGTLAMNLVPFGHFAFFFLLFGLLARFSRQIREESTFRLPAARTNRKLMWLSLGYGVFNVLHLWMLNALFGTSWLEPQVVQQLITVVFIAGLALVFYFNTRLFARGLSLQEEQDLTV